MPEVNASKSSNASLSFSFRENSANIIELKHVTKQFNDNGFIAVNDFNLEVKRGEFVTFLGPSGCGKTTTLRMIAGFELPTSGEILLNGKPIQNLPPYERPINTVFQRYALFPHMNIYDNIAFGLKQRKGAKKVPKEEIDHKVKHMLTLVDLEGFEDRSVATLSGGQQQRIAIARALVNEPEILLLDEPLGALDLKMRQEMQLELKAMHDRLGITFIYVTHDQEEALTMSDKIVVMSEGHIQQIGTPEDIYNEPKNAFVADFVGESNIFSGIMTGKMKVRFCGGEFTCVDDIPEGTHITAVVRPEDVELVPIIKYNAPTGNINSKEGDEKGPSELCEDKTAWKDAAIKENNIQNQVSDSDRYHPENRNERNDSSKSNGLAAERKAWTIQGTVTGVIFKGMHYEITIQSGKNEIVARSTRRAKVGDRVGISLEPDGIHVMIAEDHTNTFLVDINKDYRLEYNGKLLHASLTKLIRGGKRLEDGTIVDANGDAIDLERTKIQASIQPEDIRMTDNEEEGLIQGNISNLIYQGSHYLYIIHTDLEQDFAVYDEDLWNMGDRVGLIMPTEKMTFTLKR